MKAKKISVLLACALLCLTSFPSERMHADALSTDPFFQELRKLPKELKRDIKIKLLEPWIDLAVWKKERVIQSGKNISDLKFSPDDRYLAVASDETCLYEVSEFKRLEESMPGSLNSGIEWVEGSEYILRGVRGTVCFEWHLGGAKKEFEMLDRHLNDDLVISPGGKEIAVYYNSTIRVKSLPDMKEIQTLTGCPEFAFSPDGNWIAKGGNKIKLIHRTDQTRNKILGNSCSYATLLFSHNSRLLSASKNGEPVVFDIFSDKNDLFNGSTGIRELQYKANLSQFFSPEGSQHIVYNENEIIIRDFNSHATARLEHGVQAPPFNKVHVFACAMDHAGRRLITGNTRGDITVFVKNNSSVSKINDFLRYKASEEQINTLSYLRYLQMLKGEKVRSQLKDVALKHLAVVDSFKKDSPETYNFLDATFGFSLPVVSEQDYLAQDM